MSHAVKGDARMQPSRLLDPAKTRKSLPLSEQDLVDIARLRKETPGQYESYVDIQPDVWAKLRIVVSGRHATLYVNDAPQPILIVNDLKGPMTGGRVALWVGPSSVGYFSHLTIHSTPASRGAAGGAGSGQLR